MFECDYFVKSKAVIECLSVVQHSNILNTGKRWGFFAFLKERIMAQFTKKLTEVAIQIKASMNARMLEFQDHLAIGLRVARVC